MKIRKINNCGKIDHLQKMFTMNNKQKHEIVFISWFKNFIYFISSQLQIEMLFKVTYYIIIFLYHYNYTFYTH